MNFTKPRYKIVKIVTLLFYAPQVSELIPNNQHNTSLFLSILILTGNTWGSCETESSNENL